MSELEKSPASFLGNIRHSIPRVIMPNIHYNLILTYASTPTILSLRMFRPVQSYPYVCFDPYNLILTYVSTTTILSLRMLRPLTILSLRMLRPLQSYPYVCFDHCNLILIYDSTTTILSLRMLRISLFTIITLFHAT